MPDKPFTPAQIAENVSALRYIPDWLRLRGMTQRTVAERMGVSEPTISKWLRGSQVMSLAQFMMLARILNAEPEDLMNAPPANGLGDVYREVHHVISDMDRETLEHWLAIGRQLRRHRGRNPGISER